MTFIKFMSLAGTSNARELYERFTPQAELLKYIKAPIVKKVADCIRSWKTRHSLTTLEQAFAEHRKEHPLSRTQSNIRALG